MSKLILLSDDDYEFLVGFDPDRDRVATRAQMVDVLHDVQAAVREGLLVDVEPTEPAQRLMTFRCGVGEHDECPSTTCGCDCHRDQTVT